MPKSLLYACVGCVLLLGISAHILSISSYSRLQPIHRSTAQAPMDRKDSWSAEEDAKLTTMVQKYGAERWSPAVDRRPFTAEEHTLIANAQSLRDNMWVDIACGLNSGRTDNSVKNHWNSNHRKSQHEACAATAAQFAHTNAAGSASATDAAATPQNNSQVWGKGKAVVIDLEDDQVEADVKVHNELPPAKRQRVSNGGGSAASGGGDDDAWLTLSLGLPQQPVPKQEPMVPVATEAPIMAAMREMVREEVDLQVAQLASSVFMGAFAGAARRL